MKLPTRLTHGFYFEQDLRTRVDGLPLRFALCQALKGLLSLQREFRAQGGVSYTGGDVVQIDAEVVVQQPVSFVPIHFTIDDI